jgi:monoamine oxidase
MSTGPRSSPLRRLARLFSIARTADDRGIPSQEALDLAREQERAALSRRRFLAGAGATAAIAMTHRAWAAPRPPNVDVAIVGAGLAGLQCAYELGRRGVQATIYEAGARVGGRQFSNRDKFPGQAAENGGELIDNLHKTMLGWVNTLGLTREDITRVEGELFYYFGGKRVSEATIVDEYRAFVAAMQADLRASTGAPTAETFNDADRALDQMSLAQYFVSRGAGPNVRRALEEAYLAEYGRECSEQSALNFLLFIHADKRSKFTPFGVYSDERFHVVEGNDKIATGIAARIPRAPQLGHALERVRATSGGRVELTFRNGNSSVVRTHDKVVLAIPFTVLRTITLDANLNLPPWKRHAIDTLGYGDNAKQMVGFDGPFWADLGSDGGSYSDLPNHQATWETNPTTATTSHAILTDYASGVRGKNMSTNAQLETAKFLGDLEKVFPGASAKASRANNKYVSHVEHWPSNPLSRGSYTCYLPGQFTTIAGNEGKTVGNLLFAGEHANSFYEWQGFMEGALLSGIDAAAEILG